MVAVASAAVVAVAASAAIATSDQMASSAAAVTPLALEAGVAWARACCDELAREGRAVVDGWPGTMTEARRRVAALLARHDLRDLTATEVADLVRDTYLAARATWLARAER